MRHRMREQYCLDVLKPGSPPLIAPGVPRSLTYPCVWPHTVK